MKFSQGIRRIILIILIPASSSFSQERQLTLNDLQGSWYNSSFLQALSRTKSVHQAVYGLYFVAFEITKKPQSENYQWLSIFNFHEGVKRQLAGISVIDDSTFSFDCIDCYDENTHFHFLSKTTLRFSNGTEFKRIQNFTAFVHEMTISGVYEDDQRQIYFFYKNGLSLWPKDKFYYEVGLDPIFFPADYFEIKNREDGNGRHLYYFFKRKETTLEIYKAIYTEGEFLEKGKKPFLILSRYEKEFYEYLYDARFQNLELKSKEQLRLLRNEVFARHRHSFDSPDLQNYFADQQWYQEYKNHKVTIDELSSLELEILDRIQNLEKDAK